VEPKRVIEWLATAEGLVKALVAFIGLPALIWAAVTKTLDPLGMPKWGTLACAAAVILAITIFFWRSFRRFDQASRLEQPDAFTLRPVDPASLIGRSDDLAKLMKSVSQNRLVLLDGESGCGKSALIFAGLIPKLEEKQDGLLPVPIRDWGDDWARGPLCAAVDAIFHGISSGEREKLGWTASPDLAAGVHELAVELDGRLRAVFSTLGRRPLLIADQFDDHQAHHRQLYLDEEANWLAPTVVARNNPFWQVVNIGLTERRLHLLVVTRADTAAGLACVRFLGEEQSVARTLPRVDAEYLRPLLTNIAPDSAVPRVVSNPDGGWVELRERLEADLKAEGSILMQQVRTALLGLRQLPLLTPHCYRNAGGLHGVETLFIYRALRRAGDAVGGGDVGLEIVRAVLGNLILPGGPNQAPKSQRASLSTLSKVTGDSTRAETILGILQQEDVIRPAETVEGGAAWQLDHDYLARAVLAEAHQADRWSMALRAGKARYEEARGNWRQRWAALLPFHTLMRICWARARNRLRFGDAASYARMCALKPLVVVFAVTLLGLGTYVGYLEVTTFGLAQVLVSRFGTADGPPGTLLIWRANDRLRHRVFSMLDGNGSRSRMLPAAEFNKWPLAHAGFEVSRAREVATVLREQLQGPGNNPNLVGLLVDNYRAVVTRLDPEYAKAEATALRAWLEQNADSEMASGLTVAFAAVAARLTQAADLKAAAALLRGRLEHEDPPWFDSSTIEEAYATISAQLTEEDAKGEATILHRRLEQVTDEKFVVGLAGAYAAVATRLADRADVRTAAEVLRTRLEHELAASVQPPSSPLSESTWQAVPTGPSLAQAYAMVGARLDEADAATEAAILRGRLEEARTGESTFDIANAYAAVAARLSEAHAKTEAGILRAHLAPEHIEGEISGVALAYSAVAPSLPAAADLKDAAAVLRVLLEQSLRARESAGQQLYYPQLPLQMQLEQGYVRVAARLSAADAKREAAFLRTSLEHEPYAVTPDLVGAYAAVAVRLADAADVRDAAVFTRSLLNQTYNGSAHRVAEAYATIAERLDDADARAEASILQKVLVEVVDNGNGLATVDSTAYAAVATRLTVATDVKTAATTLRSRIERELAAMFNANTNLSFILWQQSNGPILEQAYATLVPRLEETDRLAEMAALRRRLELEDDVRIAGGLVGAYAAVAARLTDPAQITAAGAFLRDRMEWVPDQNVADRFALAYAQLARVVFDRTDAAGRSACVREILTLAGHPFLADPAPLLTVLQPSANRDFGNDAMAAVIWAEQTYGIKPKQLRPAPTPLWGGG
jgi:hypothetical protein